MGRGGLSKQALSLIERSRMKIPSLRLRALHRAYGLSTKERRELSKLYAFESLVQDTGEDHEFAEAILSTMDPRKATAVYVIGGRQLTVNSRLLQQEAAAFLGRTGNRLIFIYPECLKMCDSCRAVWGSNARRDGLLLQRSIEVVGKQRLKNRIEFYGIDVHKAGADISALNVLSLCSPVTSTTIAHSISSDYLAGYVYVEGPRDRWVLLKHTEANRVLGMMAVWLKHEER